MEMEKQSFIPLFVLEDKENLIKIVFKIEASVLQEFLKAIANKDLMTKIYKVETDTDCADCKVRYSNNEQQILACGVLHTLADANLQLLKEGEAFPRELAEAYRHCLEVVSHCEPGETQIPLFVKKELLS